MTTLRIFYSTVIAIFLFLFLNENNVLAQTYSETVNVSLKLSLCGDSVVEGQEDCEINQPFSKTCSDFGYQEGLLKCDYSCSFDYSDCKYIKKEDPKDEPKPEEKPNLPVSPIPSYLPFLLSLFDFNRDGRLDFLELTNLLTNWVDGWRLFRVADDDSKSEVKGTCDVNKDNVCNVIDFSIILYYVDND